jgi:Glycosyltransferase family 87
MTEKITSGGVVQSNSPGRAGLETGKLVFALICCLPTLAFTFYVILCVPFSFFDFISYWSAGHLYLTHQNPYSSASAFALELSMGWKRSYPLVMLCPPWTLFINAIFGLLPFRTSQHIWSLVLSSLDGISAYYLWRYFGGEKRTVWIAALVFLSFSPVITVAHLCQVTPIMLVCFTAFLYCVRSERWVLAGISLLGMSIKPHLLWLVFIAIALWAIRTRKGRMLVAALVTVALFTAGALAFNPKAIHFFNDAYGPAIATSCGFGGALRLTFGIQHAWLQYLPCVAGIAWFAWYWRKHGHNWNWTEHMPLLLVVSVASSPYCWFHDFILVLPAFIALAVRGAWRSLMTPFFWLAIQAAILMAPAEAYKAAVSALWIGFWLLASWCCEALDRRAAAWQSQPTSADRAAQQA